MASTDKIALACERAAKIIMRAMMAAVCGYCCSTQMPRASRRNWAHRVNIIRMSDLPYPVGTLRKVSSPLSTALTASN